MARVALQARPGREFDHPCSAWSPASEKAGDAAQSELGLQSEDLRVYGLWHGQFK